MERLLLMGGALALHRVLVMIRIWLLLLGWSTILCMTNEWRFGTLENN